MLRQLTCPIWYIVRKFRRTATYIKNRQKFAMIVVVELDKCEQRKKELEKEIAKLTAN